MPESTLHAEEQNQSLQCHFIKGLCSSLIWFLLIIATLWIAVIAAILYAIILPFTACIPPLSIITDFLLKVVQWPRFCAQSMMEGRKIC